MKREGAGTVYTEAEGISFVASRKVLLGVCSAFELSVGAFHDVGWPELPLHLGWALHWMI